MINKVLKGSLNASAFILLTLAELGEIAVESFHPKKYVFTALGRAALGLDSGETSWKSQTLKDKIGELIKSGLVIKDNRCKKYRLSNSGQKSTDEINDYFASVNKKWDGIFKILIFDIPERKKEYRNWLRNALYALDFKQLQKSVFIGKNPLPGSFIKEISYLGLDEFINIFSIREIDNKNKIIRNFKNN